MQEKKQNSSVRIVLGTACVLGLATVFVFQQFNVAGLIAGVKPAYVFFINRTVRFILNDALTILLIWTLFPQRKYVIFSLWVQLFGFFFVLIPYFVLKAYWPSYNGPLLSFMHRLILNPTMLLLLIPAFYYQRRIEGPRDNAA